jgi:hypothetical protein
VELLSLRTLLAVATVAMLAGCGGTPARPSLPGITLQVDDPITARSVACATCEVALVVVAEFPVTVGDPNGPGGVLARIEVVATDESRSTEVGRNVRPNADVAYPVRDVPAGATLTVPAGIVIGPAPPPRDSLSVTILARLEDGRASTRTVPLVVAAAATGRRP